MKAWIFVLVMMSSNAFAANFSLGYSQAPGEAMRFSEVCTAEVGCLWSTGPMQNELEAMISIDEQKNIVLVSQYGALPLGRVVADVVDRESKSGWRYGQLEIEGENNLEIESSIETRRWFPGVDIKTGAPFRQVRTSKEISFQYTAQDGAEIEIRFSGSSVQKRSRYEEWGKDLSVELKEIAVD